MVESVNTCNITEAARRRVGSGSTVKPTHPHQLNPPDAVPNSVCQTQNSTDTQRSILFQWWGRLSCVSLFCLFLCLLLFFYVQSTFHPTLL